MVFFTMFLPLQAKAPSHKQAYSLLQTADGTKFW